MARIYEEEVEGLWIPPSIRASLTRYVVHGIAPGNFLRAVLENDLKTAVGVADKDNLTALGAIIKFIFNGLPGTSWGSPDAVRDWLARNSPGGA